MTYRPVYQTVDGAADPALADPAPATSALLQRVYRRQHALYTGFGGCWTWCDLRAYGPRTLSHQVALPPWTTHGHVVILAGGDGDVDLTSAADATGTTLVVYTPIIDLAAAQYYSTRVVDDALGADGYAALKMANATSSSWTTAQLDIVVGSDVQVYGLGWWPIHEEQ